MLVLLWALAFLPAMVHLAWHDIAITSPVGALGPAIAGFWFARSLREIRLNVVWLGALLTIVLWSINWMMLSGRVCCSTMN